jgi:hypothetical protein
MTRPDPTGDHAEMRSRRVVDRVFRNPDTGELAVVQLPNLSLGVFLVATAVRQIVDPSGTTRAVVSAVGTAALTWWSLDEVLRGDSPFRRALGAVVLLATITGLLLH